MTRRYPEEDVDRGLIAAATLGIRPAERETGIPESTIRGWIDSYPERYAELREQEAPRWRARAAAAFEDVVEEMSAVEWELVKKMKDEAPDLQGKDVANALKSVSIAKGINTDKANVLRGQPAATVEHRIDMAAIDRLLREVGAVSATATGAVRFEEDDVLDAEVVDAPELTDGEAP